MDDKNKSLQAENFRKEKDRLEGVHNKLKSHLCANAVLTITDPAALDDDVRVAPGEVKVSEDHCRNARRNGSKYCQPCSDAYHAANN